MRRKMDADGYCPITLIASFYRVQTFTRDLHVVIDAINSSDKLELAADNFKVRTKQNPTKWPILDKGPVTLPPIRVSQVTASLSQLNVDNLNPNVAEFVPSSRRRASKSTDEDEEEKNWREVKRKTNNNNNNNNKVCLRSQNRH